MAASLLSSFAVRHEDVADTGSLRGDVVAFLRTLNGFLRHPVVARVVPDVIAEAARSAELMRELRLKVQQPRRASAARLLRKTITRGELPADADVELGVDLLMAPVYWRVIVLQTPIEDRDLDALATAVVAALSTATVRSAAIADYLVRRWKRTPVSAVPEAA